MYTYFCSASGNPAFFATARRAVAGLGDSGLLNSLLQRIDKQGRHITARLLLDLLKTGGAGDIDLGDLVANHIQTYQQQATLQQDWTQLFGHGTVGIVQRLRHTFTAGGEVATNFIALRDTSQAERHGLAADDEHPLVTLCDGGQEFLHHDAGGAILVQRLDDGAQVHTISAHAEDAHAPHAVQRLEDDVLVLGVEGAVIKAHGNSNARAIFCAIRQAKSMVDGGVVDVIREEVAKLSVEDEKEE